MSQRRRRESVSAKEKRVIMKELVKGQEAAAQLKVLLHNPFETQPSLSSRQLMENVLRSFTHALSAINSSPSELASADELAHPNLFFPGQNGSPVAGSGNGLTSGDCSESRKRSQKGGRGCYNRRKGAETWTILSCTTDDNHAWRKYGQKEIQNSEFPRSYFRCSHKYDQGCLAIKQVQRDQEKRDIYQTTYIGIHTCNATLTDSTTRQSYLLNSDRDSKVPNLQDHHISSPSLTKKQEIFEDTQTDVVDHNLDPCLWSDLKDFQPSKPTIVPLKMKSDNNADNVHSCTDSQHLDMDFGGDIHFATDFHFHESQLL